MQQTDLPLANPLTALYEQMGKNQFFPLKWYLTVSHFVHDLGVENLPPPFTTISSCYTLHTAILRTYHLEIPQHPSYPSPLQKSISLTQGLGNQRGGLITMTHWVEGVYLLTESLVPRDYRTRPNIMDDSGHSHHYTGYLTRHRKIQPPHRGLHFRILIRRNHLRLSH